MKTHRHESGFALLLVFLMAACVAIMLYMEIPRVAFEAERQHELLLIDRGNQFKRAIQVFVTDKTNNPAHRYPASIEELENFNNHRYLRRRYVDPMTGKDEWRLVHINGGVLTDSVLTKQANPNGTSASAGPAPAAYISEQTFISNAGAGGAAGRGGGLARAMGRRPSDSAVPGGPPGGSLGGSGSDPNNPLPGGSPGMPGSAGGVIPPGMPTAPGFVPGALPGQPGGANMPGMPGVPGVPGVAGLAGVTGAPGMLGSSSSGQTQTCSAYIGGCTTTASSGTSGQPGGMPGLPPQPGNSALGGAINSSVAAGGGMGGFGPPGFPANPQAQSAAAGMINSILTTPRPGGMPTNMPGSTIGGGIAGVASKFEAEGIMVINDRTAINEWEYNFDMTKYRAPPNPVGGTPGQPVTPTNSSPPGTPIGTPIGSQIPATTPNFSMPAGGGH